MYISSVPFLCPVIFVSNKKCAKVTKKKYRFFSDDILTEAQAKLNYKRLALMYHPDKGGSDELMRELNYEYQLLKEELRKNEKQGVALTELKRDFTLVKIGDTVYVNGTECVVIGVFTHSFLARAKGRMRTAVFDKRTGESLYTKRKFIATWEK